MSFFTANLKSQWRYSNMLTRLIAINVVVFVVENLLLTFLRLFRSDTGWLHALIDHLAVPASLSTLAIQPWSLITYQFLHQTIFENILHIVFNMLWLFWMGRIFTEFQSGKRLLGVYLTGGIAGAFLYILFYNTFPLFADAVSYSHAIGASASVLAITMAVATLVPDYTIHLLFFGPVKMKYIALVTLVLDLLSISGSNAGGHIAHLGGAAFGFLFIRQLRQGRDLTRWVDAMAGFFVSLFRPKPKMKVSWRNDGPRPGKPAQPDQATIDRILDKIGRAGYGSLTKEERDLLFKASNKKSHD
jgi:membrane associated rhomboid family serine protease